MPVGISKTFFKLATGPELQPEHTLVLIGTSVGGPAETPFRLRTSVTPREVLKRGPLLEAYKAALNEGAKDIVLYRINGIHASTTFMGGFYNPTTGLDEEKPVMELKAVGAHEDYNDVSFLLNETQMHVFLSAESTEPEKIYDLQKYLTIKDLVNAINADAEYGIVNFNAQSFNDKYLTTKLYGYNARNGARKYLGGITNSTMGSSESHLIDSRDTHINDLNNRLLKALYSESAYDQDNYIINSTLGMFDCGVVCVSGLYHDDSINLVESIGRFCLTKSNEHGQGCVGVIGIKPIPTPTEDLVKAKVDELLNMRQEIDRGGAINPDNPSVITSYGSAGWESYVQVVVGDSLTYNELLEKQYAPLAYHYAGKQSSLLVHQAPTNKQLNGFGYLSYELNKEDVDKLLSNGYISIIRSVRRGFVPYAQTNYVKEIDSPFKSPSTIRVVHYVASRLTNLLDDEIGSRTTPMSRKSLKAKTEELAQELMTPDVVRNYDLAFKFSRKRGEMTIKLSITPLTEVESITSIVRLPFVQGAIE